MPTFTLVVQAPGRDPETRTFSGERTVVGREVGDLALHDNEVSGRHGEFFFEENELRYCDLGSTNGSFRADGQRLTTPTALHAGQSVRVGSCTLTVQGIDGLGGPTVPAARRARGTMVMGPGMLPTRPGSNLPPTPVGAGAAAGGVRAGIASGARELPPPLPAPPRAAAAPPPSPAAPAPARPASGLPPPLPARGAGPPPVAAAAPPPPPPPPATAATPGEDPAPSPAAVTPGVGAAAVAGEIVGGLRDAAERMGAEVLDLAHSLDEAAAAAPGQDPVRSAKHFLGTAVAVVRRDPVDALLLAGLFVAPITALQILAELGPIFGLLLAVVQMVLGPLAAVTAGRWALARLRGQSTDAVSCWRETLGRGAREWANALVFLLVAGLGCLLFLVPGILVGIFAVPIYLVEGRQFVDVNLRNLELVQTQLGRVVKTALVALAFALVPGLAVAAVAWVLGKVPQLGGVMTTLVWAGLTLVAIPVGAVFATAFYEAVRRDAPQGG
jgi:hypothetical protein